MLLPNIQVDHFLKSCAPIFCPLSLAQPNTTAAIFLLSMRLHVTLLRALLHIFFPLFWLLEFPLLRFVNFRTNARERETVIPSASWRVPLLTWRTASPKHLQDVERFIETQRGHEPPSVGLSNRNFLFSKAKLHSRCIAQLHWLLRWSRRCGGGIGYPPGAQAAFCTFREA